MKKEPLESIRLHLMLAVFLNKLEVIDSSHVKAIAWHYTALDIARFSYMNEWVGEIYSDFGD